MCFMINVSATESITFYRVKVRNNIILLECGVPARKALLKFSLDDNMLHICHE